MKKFNRAKCLLIKNEYLKDCYKNFEPIPWIIIWVKSFPLWWWSIWLDQKFSNTILTMCQVFIFVFKQNPSQTLRTFQSLRPVQQPKVYSLTSQALQMHDCRDMFLHFDITNWIKLSDLCCRWEYLRAILGFLQVKHGPQVRAGCMYLAKTRAWARLCKTWNM